MSYLVLARKWRPQTFDAVFGQEHITRVLTNAIKSSRLAHAFLFSGPRGVGKTSTARILAKALNCDRGPIPVPCNQCPVCREITSGSSSSIIEIDGASNNSVEDIRSLREKVGMIPTTGRFKIYIIDEVHMLSQAAFNALLKTLEEPPAHVKFIFATTEAHKIPATILSRCQRFDFKRIASRRIMDNLNMILDKEGISATSKALELIAKAADGSMRDALSIFDQILSTSGSELVESEVEELLGMVGREKLKVMAEAVAAGDAGAVLNQLQAVLSMGISLQSYWRQLMEYFRDGLMLRIAGGGVDVPEDEIRSVEEVFNPFSEEDLIRTLKNLAEGFDRFRNSQQPRVVAEMVLLKVCDRRPYVGLEDIISRLKDLEKSLSNSINSSMAISQPMRPAANTVADRNASSQTAAKPSFPAGVPPGEEPPVVGDNDNLQQLYSQLIHRVGKKSLASLLPHGSIVKFNDDRIVLGFEKGFEKMVNSPGNVKVLQSELEKILNRPIRLEFTDDNLPSGQSEVSQANRDKSACREQELEAVNSNPVFKQITEMFNAKVLQIQKINS